MLKRIKKLILLSLLFLILIFLLTGIFFKDGLPRDTKVNILLLGVAGGTHAGAQLTDTIILASVDPVKNEVVLLSIPRDLHLTDLKGKINSVYLLGEEKKRGGGLVLAKAVVSRVTGQSVDYAIKIDFTGFKKAVDLVGGLKVEVENSFDDYGYPIEGKENDLCDQKEEEITKLATVSAHPWEVYPCRFERVYFEKGLNRMDGQTALKFVRSRNAQGEEGTDFARSRRQQKIMVAFKNKLLEAETLFNPFKIISLYNILSASVETDIHLSRFDDFIKLAQKMKEAKIRSAVIDYGDKEKGTAGLLINPPAEQYGAWVLIPRMGEDNFSEIQDYIKCQFENGNCPIK